MTSRGPATRWWPWCVRRLAPAWQVDAAAPRQRRCRHRCRQGRNRSRLSERACRLPRWPRAGQHRQGDAAAARARSGRTLAPPRSQGRLHQRLFRLAPPRPRLLASASQDVLRPARRRPQQRHVGGSIERPEPTVQTQAARAAVLASLAAVDLIVIFEEDTPIELIRAMRPTSVGQGSGLPRRRCGRGRHRQGSRRRGAAGRNDAGLQHQRDDRTICTLGLIQLRSGVTYPQPAWLRDRASAAAVPRRSGQNARLTARRRPAAEGSRLPSRNTDRAERIRHHDATILGDQRDRKPICHGEVQAIGKFAIARPLLVGTKIGHRTLDFDDRSNRHVCREPEHRCGVRSRAGIRTRLA